MDIAEDEIVTATNVINGLSGFLIALFANSPLEHGKLVGGKAIRETFWRRLDKARAGMPPKKFQNLEEYLSYCFELDTVMVFEDGKYFCPHQIFSDYAKDFDEEKTFAAFLVQEETIWFDARPRAFGTIEVRPCCLQPWEDKMSVAAFVLGLVENLSETEKFLGDFLWEDLTLLRLEAIKEAMQAKVKTKNSANVPIADLLLSLYEISEKGLKKRGIGEEKYIQSLRDRIKNRTVPADRVIEVFKEKGVDGVISYSAYQG